jgi:hypothetical protein
VRHSPPPVAANVVRQISKIWVVLPVADFTTGFQILLLPQQLPFFFFQSADCTGQAYLFINPNEAPPQTDEVYQLARVV